MDEYDILVVGCGPAGSTAAIYAKRYGMSVAVIEAGIIGGQLSTAAEVENYPAIPRMSGSEYSEKVRAHLERLQIPILFGTVDSIARVDEWFVLAFSSEKVRCKGLILATGASHRHLGVPGESELLGKGVSYCATCDGYFFKDKPVVLVGGGNTAVTYALFMAGIASKVYVVHRRDEFRAENALVERLKANSKVQLVLNSVVERIEGTDKVERVVVKDVKTGKQSVISADAVFISVGEAPQSELALKLGIAVDEKGYVKTNERQETSMPGVYAAGDVCGKGWPQAINAAAQGMAAGIECSRYVQSLKKH